MRTERSDEVIARIRTAAIARAGGALAFDGDGTLWSGDVGEDFFFALLEAGGLRPPAHDALRAAALEHGLDEGGAPELVARRLFEAHEAGRFPESRMYEMTAWLCAGWARADVHTFARGVLERGGLAGRLHREAIRVLEWARTEGLEVFLVSASPRPIVEEAAALLGLSAANVVAITPLYEGDTMQPAVASPVPYGAGKVAALRVQIGARPLLAAFGDNAFDVPMLREAEVRIAVRPKERLRAKASEVPALVAMEPE